MDTDMTLQRLDILLKVYKNEGITQQEMAKETGLLSGSVSRHLMKLGLYYHNKTEKGLGLVTQSPSPFNRRQMAAYLTTKGKQTMRILEEILDA